MLPHDIHLKQPGTVEAGEELSISRVMVNGGHETVKLGCHLRDAWRGSLRLILELLRFMVHKATMKTFPILKTGKKNMRILHRKPLASIFDHCP